MFGSVMLKWLIMCCVSVVVVVMLICWLSMVCMVILKLF